MNAVISGALGVAVLADDQTCKILWDESPDEIQVIPTEEAARLVRRAGDAVVLSNATVEKITDSLAFETDLAQALRLAINVLDSALSDDSVEASAEALELFLEEPRIYDAMSDALYAFPAPKGTEFGRHIGISWSRHFTHVEQLFSQLSDEQKAIELASMEWSRISAGRIADPKERARVTRELLRRGYHRKMARLIADGHVVGSIFVEFHDAQVQKEICEESLILQWVKSVQKAIRAQITANFAAMEQEPGKETEVKGKSQDFFKEATGQVKAAVWCLKRRRAEDAKHIVIS